MRRVLLVGALILLWCAPAQAATVARSGEFTLHAREDDGQLCITLRRERRYQGQECGPIPRSPHRALQITPDIGFDNYASAVPGTVHTAELESRNGQRTRHPTFAARGFSSRFVLLPAPPSAVFVRFYGADGALLGIDPGPAGYIDIFANETSVFGTHEAGVEAHTEAWLEPTPEQPDRLRTLACVSVTNSGGGTDVCDRDSDNLLVVMGSCDGPDVVGGIVAAGVAEVRLTLTSGEPHIVPTRALPAAFGGRRALGAPVPRGQGVREAVAFDAVGQRVARAAVGAPRASRARARTAETTPSSGRWCPSLRRPVRSRSAQPARTRCSSPIRGSGCASGSSRSRPTCARRRRSIPTSRG